MYSIVAREEFSETTFLWEIHAPDVAASALPGHFVMLRLYDGGERIPLTVADYDRERGTVTIVVQALGKTTREMRDRYRRRRRVRGFRRAAGLPQHVEQSCRATSFSSAAASASRRCIRSCAHSRQAGNRTTGYHGIPHQGPGVLGRKIPRIRRRADHLHRRRQLRPAGTSSPRALQEIAGEATSRTRSSPSAPCR